MLRNIYAKYQNNRDMGIETKEKPLVTLTDMFNVDILDFKRNNDFFVHTFCVKRNAPDKKKIHSKK